MKYKNTWVAVMMMSAGLNEGQSHDFINSTGGTVVASYDLSGSELWHGFFLKPNRFLAVPLNHSQRDYQYINYPRYRAQNIPQHRLVCDLKGPPGNDDQSKCKDEFPHVHYDDFSMAMNLANELCGAFGASIVPDFQAPTSFVGTSLEPKPAESHHFHYQLTHGLKFDCVALAVE